MFAAFIIIMLSFLKNRLTVIKNVLVMQKIYVFLYI